MGKLLTNNNWFKSIIIGFVFILSLSVLWHYKFWFISSLSTFNNWYPTWGVSVWWIKNAVAFVLLIVGAISVFYLWELNRKILSNPKAIYIKLFLVYLLLLLLFEGNHPFTMVKMYSRLDDEVNYFYVDDCKGNLIPLKKLGTKSGGELSHYYYNYNENKSIKKEEIGYLMWKQLNLSNNAIKDKRCYCLYKKPIKISQHKIKLYESCQ